MGRQRNGEKKVLRGTAQMENCVKLLVEHEIDRVAVKSILNLAYEFDLFGEGDFLNQSEAVSTPKHSSAIELAPIVNEHTRNSLLPPTTSLHMVAVPSQSMSIH